MKDRRWGQYVPGLERRTNRLGTPETEEVRLHTHDSSGASGTHKIRGFERERRHLLSVAFRILGAQSDAEDVVQETWIRYNSADESRIRNLPAWLTAVTTRLCLDLMRRQRQVTQETDEVDAESCDNPEETALLASELTAAFGIVLDELTPPQRVALVLHDAFGAPFEEIAHVLETTVDSAKKLASRARGRIRHRAEVHPEATEEAGQVVEAFLQATQQGDIDRLIELLDPNVIRLADPHVLPADGLQRVQGAQNVAEDARIYQANARKARVVSIDGRPGIAVFTGSRIQTVLVLQVTWNRIVQYDVIADPQRLALLHITSINK